jgi:hypothetical protein
MTRPRVYVDAARNPFGRMMMCHMFSPDPDALHAMADRIRVQRKWFQNPATMPKVSWPHYDICQSKRALALTAGAVELDRYQTVAMGTVIKNIFWDANVDPLRFFTDHLAHERQRIADWLAGEGFACA